jgi:hypothetical protein
VPPTSRCKKRYCDYCWRCSCCRGVFDTLLLGAALPCAVVYRRYCWTTRSGLSTKCWSETHSWRSTCRSLRRSWRPCRRPTRQTPPQSSMHRWESVCPWVCPWVAGVASVALSVAHFRCVVRADARPGQPCTVCCPEACQRRRMCVGVQCRSRCSLYCELIRDVLSACDCQT